LSERSRWSLPALAAVLYFSEGLPYGIVNETINLYLSDLHINLKTIGLASSVGLVWTLKFLWAPLLDTFGTYRSWIVGALLVIAACIATFAIAPAASLVFWIAMAVLAFASATQDIAIDALTIRLTPEKTLGIVNSVRVASYRVAMIAAGGGIAVASARLGWSGAFLLAAVIPLLVIAKVLFAVPANRGSEQRQENPFRALLGWLRRPGALLLLAVILLYRLGDNTLTSMIRPYWISRGFTAAEVGNVTTTLAMICTIAGAFAGGAFIARFGIYSALVWLGISQMASNVVYAIVATTNAGGRSALYTASVVESFTTGLGTAAFLSFVMFICDRDNAATEFAALSGLFVLARTISQSVSGFGAENLGFASYFWLTTALALPGLLILPLIRERVRGAPATIVTG
jgi:MFS transporter, PAT family, beta-lactamase induction signal transducer AmpG